jgi:PAS domain S-box-containing protein
MKPLSASDWSLELGDVSLAAAVVQSSRDGYAVTDRDTRYLLWNAAMERFTGMPAAAVLGRNAYEVFPQLRDLGLDAAWNRALAGEATAIDGVEFVEPDGARKVYDRRYLPLRDPGGAVVGVISIIRDATARHAAADVLRTTETKLLMAAEAAGIGLWTWDRTTDVITWDDATCTLYGRTPGDAPRTFGEYAAMVHPEDRERVVDRVARGGAGGHWEHEYRIMRGDGAVRWLLTRTRSDRTDLVLGAVVDVTERKAAEDRQRTAQRLEIVGQLTAGIAHNFNNILMGMLPNLQLAARSAPPALVPMLRDAQHAAMRAAGVVQELMTYAGRSRPATRLVLPVGPLVEQITAFCRTTFDRRIEIVVTCRDAPTAEVDASQLEQAVLNLMINARDAVDVAAISAPCIAVTCEPVADAAELDSRGGAWVVIRIRDNGVGMDAATLVRIYEPFFTTKPVGKGTGLGLATTQAIVRNHDGFMRCRSSPGGGTTFSLYLPAAAPAHSEPTT